MCMCVKNTMKTSALTLAAVAAAASGEVPCGGLEHARFAVIRSGGWIEWHFFRSSVFETTRSGGFKRRVSIRIPELNNNAKHSFPL